MKIIYLFLSILIILQACLSVPMDINPAEDWLMEPLDDSFSEDSMEVDLAQERMEHEAIMTNVYMEKLRLMLKYPAISKDRMSQYRLVLQRVQSLLVHVNFLGSAREAVAFESLSQWINAIFSSIAENKASDEINRDIQSLMNHVSPYLDALSGLPDGLGTDSGQSNSINTLPAVPLPFENHEPGQHVKFSDLPESLIQNMILPRLGVKDLPKLALVNKNSKSTVHDYAEGLKYHKEIMLKCGQMLGQDLLRNLYLGKHPDDSNLFIDRFTDEASIECLEAVSMVCQSYPSNSKISLYPILHGVAFASPDADQDHQRLQELQLSKLKALSGCRIALDLDFSPGARFDVARLIHDHDIILTSLEVSGLMSDYSTIAEVFANPRNQINELKLVFATYDSPKFQEIIDAMTRYKSNVETMSFVSFDDREQDDELNEDSFAFKLSTLLRSPSNNVKRIYIEDVLIGNADVRYLFDSLNNRHSHVESLELKLEEFMTMLMESGQLLSEDYKFKHLAFEKTLSDIEEEADQGGILADNISEYITETGNKLESFELNWMPLSAQVISQLKSSLLHSNCKVKKITLRQSEIGSEGALTLASLLQNSRNIVSLDLGSNPLDVTGILALSTAIRYTKQEFNLALANIELDMESLTSLLDTILMPDSPLKTLTISRKAMNAIPRDHPNRRHFLSTIWNLQEAGRVIISNDFF